MIRPIPISVLSAENCEYSGVHMVLSFKYRHQVLLFFFFCFLKLVRWCKTTWNKIDAQMWISAVHLYQQLRRVSTVCDARCGPEWDHQGCCETKIFESAGYSAWPHRSETVTHTIASSCSRKGEQASRQISGCRLPTVLPALQLDWELAKTNWNFTSKLRIFSLLMI